MRSAFLDRPNRPIIAAACGPDGAIRAVQECSTHTLFLGTGLKRRYQSRRCGDDSHPGEEIYTPSGDEARSQRLRWILTRANQRSFPIPYVTHSQGFTSRLVGSEGSWQRFSSQERTQKN